MEIYLEFVLGFSREKEPVRCMSVYREKEIWYKELAHVILKADKFKLCGADDPVQVRRLEAALTPRRAGVCQAGGTNVPV